MDLLGVVSPGMSQVADGARADLPLTKTLVPGLSAGIAGFAFFPKHPVLGFLGGEVLGQNAYRLYRGRGADRARSLSNVGAMGCAVGGALLWKRHPFWGGVAGFLAGLAASALIPGSNANTFVSRYAR
jgi:peptidoglycan/LPS O-acetylase OafA/YrhL